MITTQNFTFDPNLKKMFACASDVDFSPTRLLQLKSHHTGKIADFRLKTVEVDRDGDTAAWVYVPVKPMAKVERVVIFND